MASNSFGTLFRITTYGESHGVALGVRRPAVRRCLIVPPSLASRAHAPSC